MQYTVTYVESYRWFVRNTKEKMQDKYAGTMNVLLHKGHSWFYYQGRYPLKEREELIYAYFKKESIVSVFECFCVDADTVYDGVCG